MVTAGLVVFLLFIAVLRLLLPSAFFAFATPLFSLGSAATGGVAGFFASFGDAAAQAARIAELEREVRALNNENLVLVTTLADVTQAMGEGTTGVVAGVIARPPLTPYDMLIIGKGTNDSITSNALVTGEGGVPLGTVSTATARTAQVLLYSAPGRATEGWVGTTRLPITLMGKGGGAFGTEVSRDAAIVAGDLVYLPGPGALPVGRVKEVATDPSSPSATLHIEPLVNVFSLTYVVVGDAL